MSTSNSIKIYCRDLESLLQKKFGDDLTMLGCTIDSLLPVGENFRSEVLKITAQVRRTNISCSEDFHFVAKTLPFTTIDMLKNIDWTRLFKKEIFMYTSIIPFYKKIEEECFAGTEKGMTDMFPMIYGHRLSLNSTAEKADRDAVILLENLRVQGYYSSDKHVGMDMTHASKAIEALAIFHALGIIANHKHPSHFESLKSTYPNPDFDYRKKDALCKELLDSIKTDAELEKFASYIEKFSTTQKGGWDPKVRTSDTWSTIVHYDFWSNNVLFRSDSAKRVEHVKFVDFQTYCWADLFLDLAYFVGTSLSDEVGTGRLDELMDIYYGALVSALRSAAIDVGAYSRRKFDERLKDLARFEFFHCAVVLNVVTGDGDGDRKDTSIPLTRRYKENSLLRWKIGQLCRIFECRGWFD